MVAPNRTSRGRLDVALTAIDPIVRVTTTGVRSIRASKSGALLGGDRRPSLRKRAYGAGTLLGDRKDSLKFAA